MTPRSTAFGLLALLVVVCTIGILLLRGATRPEDAPVPRPGEPAARSGDRPGEEAPPSDLSGTALTVENRAVAGTIVRALLLGPAADARFGQTAWLRRVRPWDPDGEPWPWLEADVDEGGAFRFPSLAPGRYGLQASAPGHASAFTVVLVGPDAARADLRLVPERAITGVVIDADGGRPLAGAVVVAMRRPASPAGPIASGEAFLREPREFARTGGEGTFRLGGLLVGRYVVVAMRDGYANRFALAAAGDADVRLALRRGGAVAGTVSDEEGAPVADVEIRVHRPDGPPESLALSGPDGGYRVEGVSPGSKRLTARRAGYRPVRKDGLEVTVGGTTLADLTLEAGLIVSGVVVDDAGYPLASAGVRLTPDRGDAPDPVSTGPDGTFACGGLPAGQVLVQVEKPGYGPESRVGVPAGKRDLRIVLRRAGSLRLRVRSAVTDAPLEDFRVRLYRQHPDFQVTIRERLTAPWRRVEAAKEGLHRIDGLAPGLVAVEVEAAGHGPASVESIDVPAGGESEVVEVTLQAGVALAGRVVRAVDGTPVAGAEVAVNVILLGMHPTGKTDRRATTGPDGTFRLEDLASGTTSLTVSHADHASVVVEREAGGDEPVEIRLPVGGTIHGVVYDEAGRPAPAVRITVAPGPGVLVRWTDTNAEGAYVVEHVTPGAVTLYCSLDRERVLVHEAVVRNGERHRADFHAGGEGTEVVGLVVEAGKPVAGANVILTSIGTEKDPSVRKFARTDDDGCFRTRAPAGRYVVVVMLQPRGILARKTIALLGPGPVTVDVRLGGGTVEGRILDPEGEPLPDAFVLAYHGDGGPDLSRSYASQALSSGGGAFKVTGLTTGTYRLIVVHGAYGTRHVDGVDVRDGETRRGVDVKLESAARLALEVSGPDGPLPGASVEILDAANRPAVLVGGVLPAEDGRIAISSVPPGTFRLVVAAEGLAPAVLDGVEVRAEGETVVPVRLVRGGSIRVEVVDGDGRPVPFARVGATGTEGELWRKPGHAYGFAPTTRVDGTVSLATVPAGRWTVEAATDTGTATATVEVRVGAVARARIVLGR